MWRALLVLLLCLWAGAASAQLLTVSTAASLADALREIGRGFEATRPGVTLRFNTAASGVLLQQIAHGAAADVFVSADVETFERGVAAGWLSAASRRDIAGNALVLVAPVQGVGLARLSDLAGPAVRRLAIGKPATVPAGRYAQQALARAGLWQAVEPKLVHADNVRQVLDYVARGEVDAAFVYRSDAMLARNRLRVVLTVTGHAPIRYPAAVVSDSRQQALAGEFVRYLAAPAAAVVLARRGFDAPRAE